jgi:FtsZ-interacting cell division protein YlmF
MSLLPHILKTTVDFLQGGVHRLQGAGLSMRLGCSIFSITPCERHVLVLLTLSLL